MDIAKTDRKKLINETKSLQYLSLLKGDFDNDDESLIMVGIQNNNVAIIEDKMVSDNEICTKIDVPLNELTAFLKSISNNSRGAGRKKIYTKDINEKIREYLNKGFSIRETAKKLNVSNSAVQRAKNPK